MPWHSNSDDDDQADRAAARLRKLEKLRLQGEYLDPLLCPKPSGLPASSFWGIAWCQNLESYSDYADRMPRGRTCLRQGHVLGLRIDPGEIFAYVTGNDLYEVLVKIDPLTAPAWKRFQSASSSGIGSLLDLLAGRLGPDLLALITSRDQGLFPSPRQIHLSCSCPDHAHLCQHVAAVLYGASLKLDHEPELFFKLRQIDPRELLQHAAARAGNLATANTPPSGTSVFEGIDLSELFGVEISEPEAALGNFTPPA